MQEGVYIGYKYSDDTLLHSISFNMIRLESILDNGVLSIRKMKELGINYCANYTGYNLDDTISCVAYKYVNPSVLDSAYNKYISSSVSLIIEGVDYIYDVSSRYINRVDEVLVSDYIPTSAIRGVIVPSMYRDVPIYSVNYLTLDSNSYLNVRDSVLMLFKYFDGHGYKVSDNSIYDYMNELKLTNNAIYKLRENNVSLDDEDYKDLVSNFHELVGELDECLGIEIARYYASLFGRKNVSVFDVVKMLCDSKNIPIYDLPISRRRNSYDR